MSQPSVYSLIIEHKELQENVDSVHLWDKIIKNFHMHPVGAVMICLIETMLLFTWRANQCK